MRQNISFSGELIRRCDRSLVTDKLVDVRTGWSAKHTGGNMCHEVSGQTTLPPYKCPPRTDAPPGPVTCLILSRMQCPNTDTLESCSNQSYIKQAAFVRRVMRCVLAGDVVRGHLTERGSCQGHLSGGVCPILMSHSKPPWTALERSLRRIYAFVGNRLHVFFQSLARRVFAQWAPGGSVPCTHHRFVWFHTGLFSTSSYSL